MVGVLFHINTLRLVAKVGFVKTFLYILSNLKNPVKRYLQILETIALSEKSPNKNMYYKGYLQPHCVEQCSLGFTTADQTSNEIKKNINALDKKSFFASQSEKILMLHITDVLFDPDHIVAHAKPNKKLIKLIEKCAKQKTKKVFLLTNIDHKTFALAIKKHPTLFTLFDGIVASCDVHMIKPNKKIFHHILEKFDIAPQQSIFIDDQQENVVAAQAVGIKSFQYRSFSKLKRELKKLNIL